MKKIYIAVTTYNRKKITELCLNQLKQVSNESDIFIYDDGSTEYDETWLKQFSDHVSISKNKGIEEQRLQHFKDFYNSEYEFLYLTDNDAFHDTNWEDMAILLHDKWNVPISLYNSNCHTHFTVDDTEQFEVIREYLPGISIFLDREMVKRVLDDSNTHGGKLIAKHGGFDWRVGELYNNKVIISRTSYVDHYGYGGMHCNLHENGDWALNPTGALFFLKKRIIDYLQYNKYLNLNYIAYKEKVISFSLWGIDKKYTQGAIENAKLAKEIYPDWRCLFYVGEIYKHVIDELKSFDNVDVIEMEELGNWSSTIWRFNAAFKHEAEIVIFRDTDSRLSLREKAAVDEWLKSDKDFHIMRDHPWHTALIMAGMWGVKNGALYKYIKFFINAKKEDYKQADQDLLSNLYASIKDETIEHSDFDFYNSNPKPFPTERRDFEFVGDIFDENNNREKNFIQPLKDALVMIDNKIINILSKLQGRWVDNKTFEYKNKKFYMPYQTIKIEGIVFEGLRDSQSRINLINNVINTYNIPNNILIDIGSNLGCFVNQYILGFKNVYGIDSDKDYIELSKELYPQLRYNFMNVDINHISTKEVFHNVRFNVVLLLSIIENFNNQKLILKEINEITDGVVIVEGHSDDIRNGKDVFYESLLKDVFYKVERLENTDPGINAPDRIGRPLWICFTNEEYSKKRI